MKRSISSLGITLLAIGCGGFTEIGAGTGASAGTAGANSGGKATTGGTSATGGTSSRGGANAQGGSQGGGANAPGAGTGGETQCQVAMDCPQLGIACQACADGKLACPFVDCVMGQCIGSFPTCADSKCVTDDQCPRSLAPCQLCADGSMACPWARCENGACTNGIDQCAGSDPCAGKSCGDACTLCQPGQVCAAVSMFCDAELKCQLNQPMCATGGCKDDTDCPGVGVCPPCPETNICAELKCVAGSCQFQCEGGGGSCSAEQGSCAGGETCCAGLECCAGVPVPEGQEYCGKICPKSDRNIKRDFTSVDPDQVLDKLSRLPIGTWAYRTESSTTRHIGPMAQDFMASFKVGSSDLTILQVDADGVAFAAIQALNARLKAVEEKSQELQRKLDESSQRCTN
jgi:hypothetical protein